MPQNNTRCWYFSGMFIVENMIAQTKTLSTLRDFSIRSPRCTTEGVAAEGDEHDGTEGQAAGDPHTDSSSASRPVGRDRHGAGRGRSPA